MEGGKAVSKERQSYPRDSLLGISAAILELWKTAPCQRRLTGVWTTPLWSRWGFTIVAHSVETAHKAIVSHCLAALCLESHAAHRRDYLAFHNTGRCTPFMYFDAVADGERMVASSVDELAAVLAAHGPLFAGGENT